MSNPIGWCTHTLNPIVGCINGCPYCYAKAMAPRVAAMASAASGKPVCDDCRTFTPHLHPERLPQLAKGRNRRVFVGSMCDLWSPGVDPDWRRQVFAACNNQSNVYLFLTKRPEHVTPTNVERYFPVTGDGDNRWLGITITHDGDLRHRFHNAPWTGSNTFVSIEPLLGPLPTGDIKQYLGTMVCGTEWAIIGPGTGAASGRTERAWVEQAARDLRDLGIPVWLKESCFKLWPDMERVQELPEGMPR